MRGLRGTDHDILDFCVRELGALGGGGASIYKSSYAARGIHHRYSWDEGRVNALGSIICEGQAITGVGLMNSSFPNDIYD